VSLSIGISVFPQDGRDPEILLRAADMALFHAKELGRDRYEFFKPELKRRAVERQSLEAELRRAVKQQEFVLHYQPKINLKTGAVCGTEALIRWQHPERGIVEPSAFIAVAEDCGLIAPIDRWVVHEACRQAHLWHQAGLPQIPVSVNISAVEFRDRDFARSISDTLTATRLPARYLEIELTETSLMSHADTTSVTLHRLKEIGIRFAIDDFGTGYSNLRYLSQFPIDVLKIDKSFIHQIAAGRNGAPIVSAVINIGKSLNCNVVAEGVETSDQFAFLVAEDCTEGQGDYFSPPVSAGQVAKIMMKQTGWASTHAEGRTEDTHSGVRHRQNSSQLFLVADTERENHAELDE